MATLKDDLVRCLAAMKGAAKLPHARVPEPALADADAARAPVIRSHPWLLGVATAALVVARRAVAGSGAAAGSRWPSAGAATLRPWRRRQPPSRAQWNEPARAPAPPAAAMPPSALTAAPPPIVEALPRSPVTAPAASARRPTRPLAYPLKPSPASAVVAAGPRRAADADRRRAADCAHVGDAPLVVAGVEQRRQAAGAGTVGVQQRVIPEAVRRAREALTAGGAPLGAHLLLGDVYYHMERYAEALREYQAALKLDPENPIATRGRELASKQVELAGQ